MTGAHATLSTAAGNTKQVNFLRVRLTLRAKFGGQNKSILVIFFISLYESAAPTCGSLRF